MYVNVVHFHFISEINYLPTYLPLFQKKVFKLQRDLEEAKAESQYFRARPVDSPVVATNRPRFTTTPVPRYDGISHWDQYREVFGAIVASNGWEEMTAALQLIVHLDGEALNVALLVPEDQRRRPGMLVETLTAHYTSPGRFSKHRHQFEQMTRPPGGRGGPGNICHSAGNIGTEGICGCRRSSEVAVSAG